MTFRFALPFLCLIALAGLVGCGESSTVEDASIRFDATPQPDLGPPDLGPVPPGPGAACSSDADCDDASCILDEEWRDGYCTSDCATNEDCGEDGTCVASGGGSNLCLANCDPDDPASCRPGYGCTTGTIGTVCIPGCSSDADCEGGLECAVGSGDFGEGTCFDPDSAVGDECAEDDECPVGGFCLAEDFAGWPGGACITTDCDYASGMGCGEGAVCAEGNFGGLCLAGCETDDDCRDSYGCVADGTYPDRMTCRPACTSDDACAGSSVCNPALGTCDDPFSDGLLGEACGRGIGPCTGGTCLREFDTGLPGAFCTYVGCTLGPDADDGCPADGVCVEGSGENLCFASCEDDDDCRAGYACRPVDEDDATRGMGCFAACENDSVCANDDFSCNVGTGLCTEAFESARLGEPCEDLEDCPGGLCLDEAGEGWPAGTCAAPGCPLTMDATGQLCPSAGVCVDDGDDDDLGYCLIACTTDTTSCRPGYACVALGGGTDGACQPACDGDDDCGTGRTCELATGLCISGT